jgi:uncharacterized protein (TIGR03437 family)
MHPRQIRSIFSAGVLSSCFIAAAIAQTQDTSQNGLLKGSYRFRHVAIQLVDTKFDPTDITASYGTITFDGAGNYTITGTSIDPSVSGGTPAVLNVSANYAIGSNGTGYITNPLFPSDPYAYIYGAVAQGVYTGSSTESQDDGSTINDIFVAIPVGAAPSNASFTSSYQTGLLDFTGAGSTAVKNGTFALSPNGAGAFSAITLNGQASNQGSVALTQTISGATYNFNGDGSTTLTFPSASGVVPPSNALFTGSKTMFQSADGNFILGWTPGGYDIFFGVKTLAVAGTNSLIGSLYFTTALEDGPGSFGTDSYSGSTRFFGNANGDGIIHQRLNLPGALSYDYGSDDLLVLNPNGTGGPDYSGYNYIFGAEGKAFVAVGTSGFYSLVVGIQAPVFSGPGVYLFPTGVVNAASYQPVTASIAPGELITVFGSGLASAPAIAPSPGFPSTLGGVSVTINDIPCPVYYVSSGQISVIVPYQLASNQTGLANIQVTNNGTKSNVVQMYWTDAAPGSFSQAQAGIGLAAAQHAATGQLLTPGNPAQPGEYISLYVTGLGTVTPSITDGAPGPSKPLSYSNVYNSGNLSISFIDYKLGGTPAAGLIQYAGLAPGLTGLYQVNVQVPSSGLGLGDQVYVELVTDFALVNQIQIPYGSAPAKLIATRNAARAARRASRAPALRLGDTKSTARRIRRGLPAADSQR